jgi:hypothetical protein
MPRLPAVVVAVGFQRVAVAIQGVFYGKQGQARGYHMLNIPYRVG